MIEFNPFNGVTPKNFKDFETLNDDSFVNIINPYANLKGKNESFKNIYKKVRERYINLKSQNFFIRDNQKCFYIYKKYKKESSFLGIVGIIRTDNYVNENIKTHEDIIFKREKNFVEYLKIVKINAEPVLLFSEIHTDIKNILKKYCLGRPFHKFKDANGYENILWRVNKAEDINIIKDKFKKTDNVFLGDGHHRASASVSLARQLAIKNGYKYFSAYIISENDLKINEFNRIIKYNSSINSNEILNKISMYFDLKKISDTNEFSYEDCQFILFLNKSAYFAKIDKSRLRQELKTKVDPEIVNDIVIKDILGITNLSKDSRVSFIKGNSDINSILEIKNKAYQDENHIGIVLNPLKLEEIKKVSFAKVKLSPKSTYIRPKIPNGMLIYEME